MTTIITTRNTASATTRLSFAERLCGSCGLCHGARCDGAHRTDRRGSPRPDGQGVEGEHRASARRAGSARRNRKSARCNFRPAARTGTVEIAARRSAYAPGGKTSATLWSQATPDASRAVLQPGGDFQVLGSSGELLWNTKTSGAGSRLECAVGGALLVLHDHGGSGPARWASDTVP